MNLFSMQRSISNVKTKTDKNIKTGRNSTSR